MVNPPIHPFSGLEGVGEDLGDFQFVQDRIKASPIEWWEVNGDIDAVDDTIEFIVPNLKTAILSEAKIVITGHSGLPNSITQLLDMVEADLLIDGTRKDTTNVGTAGRLTNFAGAVAMGGLGNIGDGKFNALGKSLVGNGTKKIEIKNIVDNGTAHASMSGWLFTT